MNNPILLSLSILGTIISSIFLTVELFQTIPDILIMIISVIGLFISGVIGIVGNLE